MPSTIKVNPTSNQDINGLLSEYKWDTNNLTYSFPTGPWQYGVNYGQGQANTFTSLTVYQKPVVKSIYDMFKAVTNLDFTEVAEGPINGGILRFGLSNVPDPTSGRYGSTFLPTWYNLREEGDTWFANHPRMDNPVRGTEAYATFMHEMGHGLGLKHPHEAGAYGTMPAAHDSLEYTVMSYRSYAGDSATGGYLNEYWSFPQTLMMYDIAALQHMYGADYNYNAGKTTYSWSPATGEMFVNGAGQGAPGGNKIFMTVWDGGGVDTYDFSNYTTDLSVDLRPGEWTKTSDAQLANLGLDANYKTKLAAGNIANALLSNNNPASLIENAIGGSGNDKLVGNDQDNILDGRGGKDTFDGGAGKDTVDYRFTPMATTVNLATDKATWAAVPGYVETLTSIENAYGGSGNDTLTGDGDVNYLWGYSGNDVLRGGAGWDQIEGGVGIDTADYQDKTAPVTLNLSLKLPGTVWSEATINGGHEDWVTTVENVWGGSGGDRLTGDSLGNLLWGGAGIDHLKGEGGNDTIYGSLGADFLTGGSGQDTFVFDTAPTADNSNINTSNLDSVMDFSHQDDTISLDDAVFKALGPGWLSLGAFNRGSGASELDDRIILTPTNNLIYDSDGSGPLRAITFAQLQPNLVVDHTDFWIY